MRKNESATWMVLFLVLLAAGLLRLRLLDLRWSATKASTRTPDS